MKNILIIIIAIIILGGLYYFFMRQSNNPDAVPAAPAQDVTASSTNTAVASTTATVSVSNFAFNPSTLTVKVGTTITWTNNDSVPHTVTSDTGTQLNSETLAHGQSYSVTFATAGTYTYHCKIHPMMKGSIVVTQ